MYFSLIKKKRFTLHNLSIFFQRQNTSLCFFFFFSGFAIETNMSQILTEKQNPFYIKRLVCVAFGSY